MDRTKHASLTLYVRLALVPLRSVVAGLISDGASRAAISSHTFRAILCKTCVLCTKFVLVCARHMYACNRYHQRRCPSIRCCLLVVMPKSKRRRRRLTEGLRMQEEKCGYVSRMAVAELRFIETETVSLSSVLSLSQLLANAKEVDPPKRGQRSQLPKWVHKPSGQCKAIRAGDAIAGGNADRPRGQQRWAPRAPRSIVDY